MPVSRSNTHKKGSGEWIPHFLAALRKNANVRSACQAAGIERRVAYFWRDADEDFRAAWDTAITEAIELLEAAAWKRALKMSDTMMIFLLKSHKPAMYRETIHHKIDITTIIRQTAEASGLDPDEAVRAAESLVRSVG